jgi:hypothetical protein
VLLACWSPKGGAGTTVVAAALGLVLARLRDADGGVLLVDLAGDLPLALGLTVPDGPGLAQWLAAAPEVPADAIGRIEVPVAPGLALLHRGAGPLPAAGGAGALLASVLAAEPRTVVADCGRLDTADTGPAAAVGAEVVAAAGRSLVVLRPCFLALRRAIAAPARADGVVLVDEPGRSIGRRDVESTVGAPVVARVRVTDQIARAVDAGLLACKLPRSLAEDLRGAA